MLKLENIKKGLQDKPCVVWEGKSINILESDKRLVLSKNNHLILEQESSQSDALGKHHWEEIDEPRALNIILSEIVMELLEYIGRK